MEKRFKCIKEFVLEKYDEDESIIEGEYFVTSVGSTWERAEHAYMSDVRLENENSWIEVTFEMLKSHFEEVK